MPRSDDTALLLDIGASITKLEKSFERASGVVKQRSKEMVDSGTSLERFFERGNLSKAIDKVFDATRFKVLDSGAARVGLFGTALESLGGAGLVAAGAIGAFALAMHQTEKAVEFTDKLDKMSKRIGVGVEDLQAFGHAFGQLGIETETGDKALQSLNEALGAVNQNLPRSERLAKVFKVLGFSREQLKGYTDSAQLLPKLAEGFNKLDNAAQAAVASRLGIEPLLPLLREGEAGINKLTNAARDLGIVMDAAMVKKGAEAADKLKALDEIMKTKTNASFVEFSGTLVTIKTLFLEATEAGLNFLAHMTGTVPLTQQIKELQQSIALARGDPLVPTSTVQKLESQLTALKLRQQINAAFGPGAATEKPKGATPPVLTSDPKKKKGYEPFTINGKPATRVDPMFIVNPLGFEDRTFNSDQIPLEPENSNKLAPQVSKDAFNEAKKQWDDVAQHIHDSTYDAIRGGLEALRSDGAKGLIDYFVNRLENKLIDSLAEGLTNAFTSAMSGAGGGDFLSTLLSAGSSLFAGGFATGGSIPPGQWGIVGERGPEPVFGGMSGATVLPNSSMGGGAVQVHVVPSEYFDVRVNRIAGAHASNVYEQVRVDRDRQRRALRGRLGSL